MDVEESMAPSAAARELGLSKTMVCLLCRQGKLLALKTPLGWLVDPDDVARLAEERRRITRQSVPSGEGART
jgi:hypothetical protein